MSHNSIIKTLTFFAIFSRPLAKEEIFLYNYSNQKKSPDQINSELKKLLQAKAIIQSGDYYTLADEPEIFNHYPQLSKRAQKNWQTAKRVAKILSSVPGVRMVAIINSLSFKIAKPSSDIDLLIVTSPNRLYTCRSQIIILLKLLGLYKTRQQIAGRFCLGFYLTEDNLNIEQIALSPQDIYFHFWLVNLTPLVGLSVYREFIAQNNWINQYFANFSAERKIALESDNLISPHQTKSKNNYPSPANFLGNKLEKAVAAYHIKHTWSLPENNTKSATTLAQSNILKLHAQDRRQYYNQLFLFTLDKLN